LSTIRERALQWSLVVAFIGTYDAAMAGDTREFITCGERIPTETLERELYRGRLVADKA
jgi:hypothetical protein